MPAAQTSPRCLLVDDDEGMRLLVQMTAEAAGITLATVADEAEALALIDAADPPLAVVITDRRLDAASDAGAVLDHARARSAETTLVVVTAHADEVARAEAAAHGATLIDKADLPSLIELLRDRLATDG